MTRSKNKTATLLCAIGLLFGGGVTLGACADDSVGSLDEYTDCMDICNRYADCIDDNYDVDKCEDRCTDDGYNNDDDTVDECENCLDDKSCTNSVFQCGDECASIVP